MIQLDLQLNERRMDMARAAASYPRADTLGAVRVRQRVPRLLERQRGGAYVCDHDRAAVSPE